MDSKTQGDKQMKININVKFTLPEGDTLTGKELAQFVSLAVTESMEQSLNRNCEPDQLTKIDVHADWCWDNR